jgi:Fe-S-cluster-containing hydrogenase component 2
MACVSTCPAKALLDGQNTPALRFIEANCLQCGLCEQACPESAISLTARYTWDSIAARRIESLNAEEPFHCLVCHEPFTTRSMIDNMTAKLAGHWMFKDEKAMRRLKLCGDCRVRDMFEQDNAGIDVHNQKA